MTEFFSPVAKLIVYITAGNFKRQSYYEYILHFLKWLTINLYSYMKDQNSKQYNYINYIIIIMAVYFPIQSISSFVLKATGSLALT